MIFSCVYSPTAVNISPAACIFRHTSPSWTALDAAWSRGGSGGRTSPRLDPDWLNVSAQTIPFRNDPRRPPDTLSPEILAYNVGPILTAGVYR